MLTTRNVPTISITYRGVELQVPQDTKYVWLSVLPNLGLTVMASPDKPTWNARMGRYTGHAVQVRQVKSDKPVTEEVLKNSLETEDKVAEVDLETEAKNTLLKQVHAIDAFLQTSKIVVSAAQRDNDFVQAHAALFASDGLFSDLVDVLNELNEAYAQKLQ